MVHLLLKSCSPEAYRYPWKLRHSKNLVGQEQEAHGSHHSPEEPLIYTFVSIWLTLDQWFSIKHEKEIVKNFNRACSFTGKVMGELTHPQTKKKFSRKRSLMVVAVNNDFLYLQCSLFLEHTS